MSLQPTSEKLRSSISEAETTLGYETDRLKRYVEDRVSRTCFRVLIYASGCLLVYFEIGLVLAMAAFALLVVADFFDVLILQLRVRPLVLEQRVASARKWAFFGGAVQGLGMASAPAFYFFSVPEPNVLYVIGCLGLSGVSAGLVLPQNRAVGLFRLGLYTIAPIILTLIQVFVFKADYIGVIDDPALTVLLAAMFIMFLTFSRSGLVHHRINSDLSRSREDLKLANAQMAAQQAEMRRLSQVAQKANDTVIITDKDRNIVWVNEAFTRSSGYTFEEAEGEQIAQLMTQGDPEILAKDDIDKAVANGQSFRGVLQSIHKNGTRFWSDVNLFPILDDQGDTEFFVTIERDVTEARQLAKEMAEARAQAEAGAKAKADFLANMSHEIRTPLGGVLGTADLLVETNLDEEQRRYVDVIRGSSLSLMTIVNDILDLSKLDSGRLELHPVTFSPEACFRETLDLLSPMARAKNLRLHLRLATDLPSAVKADDGRLRQVLTNILGNAIKFTETGSVSLSLSMTREGDLQFEVTDTGIGIDPDKIEQIFDHFMQAEASTTRRFGGTGLGLSISRHIVDVMGGHISVDSAVGKGSTFRVTVPVEVLEGFGFVATDGRHARVQEFGLKSGLSILIADDNRTNRFLLEKYLKDQPVEVQFAVDGRDALEKVATADFDLVFMDISMPNMGGVQATQEIRKLLKPQPTIVALTAHALEDERHLCVRAGMDDVLAKPIRKVEFLDWIAAFQRGAKQNERAI